MSYIRNTGEINAIYQGSTIGTVVLLTAVPPDAAADEPDERLYRYQTLDQILL